MMVQQLQERYRASHTTYGTLAQIGYSGTASLEGYYTVSVTGNTATGYVAAAAGTSSGGQSSDAVGSTSCATLTITVSATNPRGVKTPDACW
jgi:type IV pilus assembly protein PilE